MEGSECANSRIAQGMQLSGWPAVAGDPFGLPGKPPLTLF
jgi:hypothetical protein